MSLINCTVEFDLFAAVTDASDAGVDVDLVALVGPVVLTPVTADHKPVMASDLSPRAAGIKLQPIAGYLDSDGQLKTGPSGTVGVRVPANDPVLDLERLVYRVDFNVRTPSGQLVEVQGGYFEAPATDITVNLADVLESTGYSSASTPPTFYTLGDVASPLGERLVTAAYQEAARDVIGALAPSDVADEIAAAIAADGTVIDAAAAAVTADIAGRDLVERGDLGVPFSVGIEGEDELIAAGTGPMGEFWWGLDASGNLEVSSLTVDDVADVGDTVTSLVADVGEVVASLNARQSTLDVEGEWVEAGIGPMGEFWWGLDDNGNFEVSSTFIDADGVVSGVVGGNAGTVHVLIGLGQSNMSGRGLPISDEIDPPNPRIFQYGANASEITTATVPLDMVDAAYGISPLTLIAREYLQRLPANDVILLIPAAKGSSALGYYNSESSAGIWNSDYEGASPDLYGLAKTQITAALAAADDRWPEMTLRIAGTYWHQGEANTFTEANYATQLDAIISDLRTHVEDSTMPFVVGGMVPEWVAAQGGTHDGVVAAHVATPSRVVRTGYAIPPANSGGNVSLNAADRVHFHREGLEELSRRMLLAWDRALRNTTTSVPIPPAEVSATVNGTTLTINWSQPMCRYTAFTVEYSLDGGAWTSVTHTTVATTATATIAATLPAQVRVSTTNTIGTSQPSTPVYATVIKEP